MNRRASQYVVRAVMLCSLLACSSDMRTGPYVPQVCTDDLPMLSMAVATKSANDLMFLTEGADCGLACECQETFACNWEFSDVPSKPGLYDVGVGDAALKCILCMAETGGGGPVETGMLEVIRVDDQGVAGCVVDSPCGGDLRFEAAWCP